MSADQPGKDYLERRRAVKAAKERGDVPFLVRTLADPVHGGLAARALGELGAVESAPAIIRLLDAPEWGTRVDASRALAQLGASEAAPRLRELAATDEKPIARSWFCSALVTLRDPAAVELTLPLLHDPEITVRNSAAHTLAELGDPATLEAVRSARPTFRRSPLDWWIFRKTFRHSLATLERSAAGKKPRGRVAEKWFRVIREAPWIVALGVIAAAFWFFVSFWGAAALVISIAVLWLLLLSVWAWGRTSE